MKKYVLMAVLFLGVWQVAAQEPAPQVIPALQEWKGAKGKLSLPSAGVVSVSPSDTARLGNTARILVSDLKEMFGWDYRYEVGKPKAKGIHLAIKADDMLGEEGYTFSVSSGVRIDAPKDKGVFWGTRSLLQMLHTGKGSISRGTARDWPLFPNRGFMLDVARKFFTIDYLRQYVKILSFYKLNEFQIHLNDNGFVQFFGNDWNKTYAAFRLESERFPGVTAKDGAYTKVEFRDLQKLGMEYGVNIIPEIDVPAHSLAFTHYKPEIGTNKYGVDHLDLHKPETYRFVDTLLAEYVTGDNPTFIGPDYHIGTDEYNKAESEKYREFTNRYLNYVEQLGKRPRMWGGLKWLAGKTPVKSKGVILDVWSYDWVDPVQSLKDGYQLINTCDEYLYIVPAAGYYRDFLDHKWLYEQWSPWIMNSRQTLEEGTEGVLGAMFAVWNDKCGNGISEQDVHYRSFPAAQVLAEKMWRGANKAVSYDKFAQLASTMPEAPGINLLAKVDKQTVLTEPGDVVKLSGTEKKSLIIKEIGYPYSVSFELKAQKGTNNSGVLFRSPHSVFYTNYENTGKFAFSRDGYTFVFHNYRLPDEEWVSVRVEGDYKGTSLYVNDKLVERLEGRTMRTFRKGSNKPESMVYQETLIFPLAELGDTLNGFQGELRNIVATPALISKK